MPKHPSTDEQVKMTWYKYTMEYSAIKSNEIQPFATPCMTQRAPCLEKKVRKGKTNALSYQSYVECKK